MYFTPTLSPRTVNPTMLKIVHMAFNINQAIDKHFRACILCKLIDIYLNCPVKNGLQVTLNTEIYMCGCGSAARQTRLNASPPSTTLAHHRTSPKHSCVTGSQQTQGNEPMLGWCWASVADGEPASREVQFYIIIHIEVGPFKAYQLSVDDFINLFKYHHDYMSITAFTRHRRR